MAPAVAQSVEGVSGHRTLALGRGWAVGLLGWLPAVVVASTGNLTVSVVDDASGQPVHARLMVAGPAAAGVVGPPGAASFRVGNGPAWVVPGNLTLAVPAGEVTLTVARGLEYLPLTATVTVNAGDQGTREFRLRRWVHMVERGWYSGEMHIHFSPDEVGEQIQAEDLNVGTTIARWLSGPDRAETSPVVEHVRVIDAHTTYSVNDLEVERFPIDRYEAPMYLVNLRQQVHLEAPTPAWPLNLEYARQARAGGGIVCAHSAVWDSVAVLVAAGEIDAIGLANNFFGYDYAYTRTRRYGNADDVAEYGDTAEGTYRLVLGKYYRLLNCGFRLPVSAGSAAGVKPNPVGGNRVYVRPGGPLTYAAFMDAFKGGRSFVTNGPMIFFSVAGVEPGGSLALAPGANRVEVEVTVISQLPLRRINLVHNGRPICVLDLREVAPGREWTWRGTVELDDHSGWLAAHVEAEHQWVRFAHTSPVWVDHPRRWTSRTDALYFAKWIRHRLAGLAADPGFADDVRRGEVAAILRTAAERFDRLAGAR